MKQASHNDHMKVVDQKGQVLKEKLKGKQKVQKGADNCLDYMEVLVHPRPNHAQLRRGDYKLQEQEEE